MVRPTINSEKHIVQFSLGAIAAGTVSAHEIIIANIAAPTTREDVRVGALVKAVHCEMWFRGGDDTAGSIYVAIICKLSSDTSNPNATDMAALHDWDNKHNILWTSQGLINDDSSVATPINNWWLKIPKGKQRFAQGDRLLLFILAQSGITDRCGTYIYKEYY